MLLCLQSRAATRPSCWQPARAATAAATALPALRPASQAAGRRAFAVGARAMTVADGGAAATHSPAQPRSSAAPSAAEPPQPPIGDRKLRILCLHGYLQNAEVFRSRIGSWRKGLKGRAEFFFVDAPFPAEPADAAAVAESGGDAGGAPGRSWWRWLDTEPGTRPSRAAQYTGWPASQAAIEAALREHAPIDGLLGFSQGATAAALYLAHAGTEEPRRQQGAAGCGWRDQLRFAVLIAGFLPRDPSYAAALQRGGQGPAVPSLHITGAADALVPAERSDALRACWRSSPADAWVHPGAHMVPTCSGEAKAVVAALLDGVKQAAAAGG